MKSNSKTGTEELLKKILHLSWRVSIFSPPMRPFVRFSTYGKEKAFGSVPYSRFFWDFDDLLQKKLLGLMYEIASPDTIVCLCIEQWKSNLEGLYENQKKALERAVRDDTEYAVRFDDRTEFVAERMRPGGRLLYVGCGSGKECFRFAKKGLHVVGIDTIASLLDIAKGWATHLGLPVDFACMDVMNLGFDPDYFDGFLLEFYGYLPSLSQTLALQRGLARILHSGGQGFVVALRKRYSSYWFRMGSRYPPSMTSWLIPYASADFLFSEADNCEERLLYGLYNRSHTLQSLSSELSHTFEVTECLYERDPRYIIAVVRREKEIEFHDTLKQSDTVLEKEVSTSSLIKITNTLRKIEILCEQLEAHAEKVSACFRDSERLPTNNCLEAISVSSDLSGFMDLLKDILGPDHLASAPLVGC